MIEAYQVELLVNSEVSTRCFIAGAGLVTLEFEAESSFEFLTYSAKLLTLGCR